MAPWDAAQYLKFEDQRTRPAVDLLTRIMLAAPTRVIDLGCGPGNSTALLAARWPGAQLAGLDSAPDMLATARRTHPTITWIDGDIASWSPSPTERYDVVYSNAALQWVPDHATLLPRLLAATAPGGVLAVQMPRNADGPAHRLMREIAADGPWAGQLAGRSRAHVQTPGVYYDLLASRARHVDLWETEYQQIMAEPAAILEWVKGTALRPFLEPLAPDQRAAFTTRYRAALEQAYQPQADGRVIFPFRRLFLICRV
jgi:trans-aconitate 2-methyltransferase